MYIQPYEIFKTYACSRYPSNLRQERAQFACALCTQSSSQLLLGPLPVSKRLAGTCLGQPWSNEKSAFADPRPLSPVPTHGLSGASAFSLGWSNRARGFRQLALRDLAHLVESHQERELGTLDSVGLQSAVMSRHHPGRPSEIGTSTGTRGNELRASDSVSVLGIVCIYILRGVCQPAHTIHSCALQHTCGSTQTPGGRLGATRHSSLRRSHLRCLFSDLSRVNDEFERVGILILLHQLEVDEPFRGRQGRAVLEPVSGRFEQGSRQLVLAVGSQPFHGLPSCLSDTPR